MALILGCLSFLPSLLPRPAAYQGLVAGITAAIGYGLGTLGAWVWREYADRGPRTPTRGSWRAFLMAAVVLSLTAIGVGLFWQRQVSELVAVEPENPAATLLVPLAAGVTFVLLVGLARAVRSAYRRLSGLLARRMGERAARATGLVLLLGVSVLLVNGVLLDAAVRTADGIYSLRDQSTPGQVAEPTTPLRSGSPDSVVAWDDLGREGRVFVGRGPAADDIAAFTGKAAEDPIRIYAGIASAEDVEERATLAVDDLERAGGFDRAELLVVTTTGTGWVEPASLGSFEYIAGGDSASVAVQYSYLPSWLSFLVDQDRARAAGRALFDAVYERWSTLPRDDRPRLHVFGESLGSFGGETAFSGEYDLRNRTSGALFVGPPNFNPLYRSFVDDRDAGSPEVEPVFREGRTIRFSNRPRDGIGPEDQPWEGSRVVYLQHPSDPITWWSPDLILTSPDWLEEPAGRDVLDEMRWVPFVSFWQVSADLALAFSTEPGHGHNYTGEHVDGWAAILQPEGWSPEKADELREIALSGQMSQAFPAADG